MILLLRKNNCLLKVLTINVIEGYGTFLKLANPYNEDGSILVNHPLVDDYDIKSGKLVDGFTLYSENISISNNELLNYNFKIYISNNKLLEIITNYKELYEKVKYNQIETIANGVYIYLKTISEEINEYGVSDKYIIENLLQLKIEKL